MALEPAANPPSAHPAAAPLQDYVGGDAWEEEAVRLLEKNKELEGGVASAGGGGCCIIV